MKGANHGGRGEHGGKAQNEVGKEQEESLAQNSARKR
jgi:hypothetical protein